MHICVCGLDMYTPCTNVCFLEKPVKGFVKTVTNQIVSFDVGYKVNSTSWYRGTRAFIGFGCVWQPHEWARKTFRSTCEENSLTQSTGRPVAPINVWIPEAGNFREDGGCAVTTLPPCIADSCKPARCSPVVCVCVRCNAGTPCCHNIDTKGSMIHTLLWTLSCR